MTEDERMSEEIRLTALRDHIEEALRKNNLPPLTVRQFTAQLTRVQTALESLKQLAT